MTDREKQRQRQSASDYGWMRIYGKCGSVVEIFGRGFHASLTPDQHWHSMKMESLTSRMTPKVTTDSLYQWKERHTFSTANGRARWVPAVHSFQPMGGWLDEAVFQWKAYLSERIWLAANKKRLRQEANQSEVEDKVRFPSKVLRLE